MCIDFDCDSKRGITGSAEDKLVIFKLTKEKLLELENTIQIKNSGVSDIKIRGDSKIFATAGWDSK